jgi:hypothetical protein
MHGTTGEAPLVRFERDEAAAPKPLAGRPPPELVRVGQMRELVRRIQADCAIEVDGNSGSVPWRLIGESVQVVADGRVRVVRPHRPWRRRWRRTPKPQVAVRAYPLFLAMS